MQPHQLHHASMLPMLQSPVGLSSAGQQTPNPACMRPQSIAGFSSAGQPIAVQQTSVQSLQGANHSTPLSRGYHPLPMSRSIPTATISSSSPSAASQPLSSLQSIPRPAALSVVPVRPSTVLARPPVINDISPSAGNARLAGDIRAPAPHLHPFRPTSVSAASPSPLPTTMSGCNVAANMPSSSPSLAHVAPQPPHSHSVPRVAPQQQAPSTSLPWVAPQQQTPSHSIPRVAPQQPQLVSSNLSHQKVPAPPQLQPTTVNKNLEPNNIVLTTGNSPLSALFLRDLDNQPCANQPNHLPPLPEIGTTFDSIDLSDFGTTGNAASTSAAEPNAVGDVVCLSDDD